MPFLVGLCFKRVACIYPVLPAIVRFFSVLMLDIRVLHEVLLPVVEKSNCFGFSFIVTDKKSLGGGSGHNYMPKGKSIVQREKSAFPATNQLHVDL